MFNGLVLLNSLTSMTLSFFLFSAFLLGALLAAFLGGILAREK